MSKIKFELDEKGFGKNVMKSSWMRDYMTEEAKKRYKGKKVTPFYGFDRAKAFVKE